MGMVPWVEFFLAGVAESATEACGQVEGLAALRDRLRHRFQAARSSALLLKLVDALFRVPATSIGRAAELLKVTPAAASYNIKKLVEAGVLREVTGRTRNRLYLADEVIGFIAGRVPPPAS
jgi:Fic family protein